MKRKTVIVENIQHLEIMQAIGKLDVRLSVQETKIDELVRRVGIQNGRVADGEAAIKKLMEDKDYMKGSRNTAKYIFSIILAIGAIVAALYGAGVIR